MRGYTQELGDFKDAILLDRKPVSGIDLARGVIEAIYAAYTSTGKGILIKIKRQSP
jgi:hypothetical protein